MSTVPHRPRGAGFDAPLSSAMALILVGSVPAFGATGWLTDDPAYYLSSSNKVDVSPIITVGEDVGGYDMIGVPDGLGAFDNGDGRDTFTFP